MRDHLVVAGGLALVLSRCPPDRLEYLFPHSLQLYRALQEDPTAVEPALVSDASHEVAQCTDQSTRDAMRRLMRATARALPAIPATA